MCIVELHLVTLNTLLTKQVCSGGWLLARDNSPCPLVKRKAINTFPTVFFIAFIGPSLQTSGSTSDVLQKGVQ